MEANQVVIGTVVAFVFAEDYDECQPVSPDDTIEYDDPKAAFAANDRTGRGGTYFKLLRRSDGGLSYDPGFHEGMKVGDEMYGYPCGGCKAWTWWHRRSVPGTTHHCDACSEQLHQHDVPDHIEQYDRES